MVWVGGWERLTATPVEVVGSVGSGGAAQARERRDSSVPVWGGWVGGWVGWVGYKGWSGWVGSSSSYSMSQRPYFATLLPLVPGRYLTICQPVWVGGWVGGWVRWIRYRSGWEGRRTLGQEAHPQEGKGEEPGGTGEEDGLLVPLHAGEEVAEGHGGFGELGWGEWMGGWV